MLKTIASDTFYRPGAPALSHFRIERLLTQIGYIVPQVSGLYAEFIHFVDLEDKLTKYEDHVLSNLLDYGFPKDTTIDQTEIEEYERGKNTILVIPRSGTVSPWSSKATDIAHHCGLHKIKRLERGIAFYLDATEKLTWGDIQAISEILHDHMTETVVYDLDKAEEILFKEKQPKPLLEIPLLQEGKSALIHANLSMGLALTTEELAYLEDAFLKVKRNPTDVELMMFAQLNSEKCRHKIFNAEWLIDGVLKKESLFSMIKNTYQVNSRGVLSAYKDNASVIVGGEGAWFYRDPVTHEYQSKIEPIHVVMKVETHNHPTGISPHSGAATGVGGEIRDETATGRGAKSKAGMVGFTVSNLEIPAFFQPWEIPYGRPKRLASALDIILEAPIGSAQFGNEFGRPTLAGFFRTFEQSIENQFGRTVRGYHKPLMIAGGVGNIRHMQVEKGNVQSAMLVVVMGGPSMLIGLGGSVASSVATNTQDENVDFASVQRENAEMQRRCQEVIDACSALGIANPIVSLHDVGAGGLANAIPELVHQHNLGGFFELRSIPTADSSLSPLELWCNEAQERFLVVISEEQFEVFKKIAKRESCPFAIIGKIIDDNKVICYDKMNENYPVDIPMEFLFGNVPRELQKTVQHENILPDFDYESLEINDIVVRLLRLPAISDKSFLIHINDRSVTGLVVRDSLVGPWQVAVADCAVTARDFEGYFGEAMAIGERPQLALINAKASARMAVGEAITNIAAACIGVLSDLRLSANWMAATHFNDEALHLYEAVQALGLELCPALNITIPVGKDSLSMQTEWEEKDVIKRVVSPLSVVITAFAPVMDIRHTLTPVLCTDCGDTQLIFIDLSNGKKRMGSSCLAQVYEQLGSNCPDVENPEILKAFFSVIQQLNLEDKILSYHDRSDGGLFVTLCEMAFAAHIGLQIDITGLGEKPNSILFNEELGAVIQVRAEDVDAVLLQLNEVGLMDCYPIGLPDENDQITIIHEEQVIFLAERITVQKLWSETSYHLQALRDNPRTAKKQYETILDKEDPGLNANLTFDLNQNIIAPYINVNAKPVVAILREQGINGHVEMAAAFHQSGFTAIDVHMNDLQSGALQLSGMKGLAVCGGFSYGDVLGAGLGWAKRILFNEKLKDEFQRFFQRTDTFTLGVCNGCQMLSGIRSIIPGTELWPDFLKNYSEQFEGRLCLVEVERSPSIFLQGMEGSRIPVVVAHGEGRAAFRHEEDQEMALKNNLITLRYVDSRGRKTNIYPANPNGSTLGVTGLTTLDGRINIMMPHPERGFRTVQYSWHPKEWQENGPWLRLFQNARVWLG